MKLKANEAWELFKLYSFIRHSKEKIIPGFKNLKVPGYPYGYLQVLKTTDVEISNILIEYYTKNIKEILNDSK